MDFLFPRRCLGCEILLSDNNESHICSACLAGIKMKNDFACAFCNSPVIGGKTCPFCRADHFLDRLFVMTSYENPLVEKIIKTMKYSFVRSLAGDMAGLMAKYLARYINFDLRSAQYLASQNTCQSCVTGLERRFTLDFNIDRDPIVVVPVPLHRRRLNWRGFNQAEIIGNGISSYFKLNFQDPLVRIRNHIPQAQINDRQSRIANAAGISKCTKPELVQGKIVLLVDDVATTGSTLDDCARALKGAGAKEIIGFVFARGNINIKAGQLHIIDKEVR